MEEKICVIPLRVFSDVTSEHYGKVFRLQRALYGLRQAIREWFLKFSSTMMELNFQQSLADPGIYIMRKNSEIRILMIVHVEDIIAVGHGSSWIKPLRAQLAQHFEITYDGEAKWCLGMGIDINSDVSIKLHQSKYMDDMLYNFNMIDANPAITSMLVSYDDNADSSILSDETPYASLVGSLNYVTVCTKPDMFCSVSILSKILKNSSTHNHWQSAKRVL
jgi:hypothetical protein